MGKHRDSVERLRESGQTFQALNQAKIAYDQLMSAGVYGSAIHVLIEKFHCYTHLYEKTKDPIALDARAELAQLILTLCRLHGISEKVYIANYLMGKVEAGRNNFAAAFYYMQEALRDFRGGATEKAVWEVQEGACLYQMDRKKDGLKLIREAIKKIHQNESKVDFFQFHVWLSGAYLKLAELLKEDDPNEAKTAFIRAEAIISSNPKLVVREQQAEALYGKLFN